MFKKYLQAAWTVLMIAALLAPGLAVSAQAPASQGTVIAYHELTGLARYMGAPVDGRPILETSAAQQAGSKEDIARSFLAAYGSQFGIRDAYADLRLLRETTSETGSGAVRFQQTHRGIPVLAGEMIVHLDSARNVLSANGEILPNLDLEVTPVVDAAAAARTALQVTAKESGLPVEALQASAPELWIYNPALLAGYKGASLLTWRVEVTPLEGLAPVRQLVLVEAQRGGVALSFNQVHAARNRLTYDANGNNVLPGTLVCNESTANCNGGTGDAYKAHLYAGKTYDFYMTYHNRDSINGAGMAIVSSVDFDDVPGGPSYENAFWSGTQMVYGAGFASADDVVAHELTHGVTERESNLFYFWQSGAINESFSDVWGEFVDLTDGTGTDGAAQRWQMGEDLPASIGVIRDMSDPTLYGDPDKMTSPNYYTGSGDNGGVHYNSGVNNKAAYLMVDGDTFNGKTVTGLGISKTAKIYYYAQTNLLVSGADYSDLYYALQTACSALTGTAGITSADCQEVKDALDAVEMNLQPVAGYNPDVAACGAGLYPASRFFDNFESGAGNWTSGATTGSNHWTYDWPYTADLGIYAHSGTHFMYAEDWPDEQTDTTLRMKTGVKVPANGKLIFHHAYALETGFDGGVIELSTTNGSSWFDAGPYIDGNTYDAALSSGFGNPLGGRSAFTGISHGYISTRLNLASLAGQTVLLRFRLGLDNQDYSLGWFIDDVQIYECVRFSDVGTNHWAYDWIETLAVNSVTGGCDTGLYCPSKGVTRAEMAVFLLRAKYGSGYTPPAVGASTGFDDVATTHWAAAWIKQLAAEGVTAGCGDGTIYCPETIVTRESMAVFLLRAKYGSGYIPPAVGASTGFSDVPVDHWAAAWIKELAAQGITGGCSPTAYCPSQTVKRDQMAVFLVGTFGLTSP
ncbi:MAG: M4 family metallopeptidase [Chloroflexota bacterium]